VTVDEKDWRTARFEENRGRLRAVAYRMLGSAGEAEDAVQEAWLRFDRADTAGVENLGGWLTTVVARVCLDLLRSRKSRREEWLDAQPHDRVAGRDPGPERDALLADSIGPALLVVLDSLAPAERLAFVLHDMFAVPFEDVARILERTPEAARQLASRARRRVQGAGPTESADRERRRAIVDAFLAASREGNFETLLALLAPDVVLRADAAAVAAGAAGEVRGANAVAEQFKGRARVALPALVDGAPGAVWAPGGQPRVVFAFTIEGGRVVAIDLLADPARIGALDLEFGPEGER
jgi:RNA polymerase sigma factor (sigma-70 family)